MSVQPTYRETRELIHCDHGQLPTYPTLASLGGVISDALRLASWRSPGFVLRYECASEGGTHSLHPNSARKPLPGGARNSQEMISPRFIESIAEVNNMSESIVRKSLDWILWLRWVMANAIGEVV